MHYAPLIEESVTIDASPDKVWRILADLRRMSRWSPNVLRVAVTTPGEVRVGTRTKNLNRMGLLVWPTSSQVVHCEPNRVLAFKIRENRCVWRYELTELADGRTEVSQRRETPDGVSARALKLEDRLFGSVGNFEVKIRRACG
ncbi:SRPBCC family protein [Nocardia sp. NPDC050710]|uniref:SRPBCC family protein n=1 Tax=Nocardia sp. NPDC050710 TaxID=3157220 RepID=UPI0033DA4F28